MAASLHVYCDAAFCGRHTIYPQHDLGAWPGLPPLDFGLDPGWLFLPDGWRVQADGDADLRFLCRDHAEAAA